MYAHHLIKQIGNTINTISILGSGWLGLPLAEHLTSKGNHVKASTTSESRFSELSSLKIEPFIVNIEQLPSNLQSYLEADLLIINIPSKNMDGFSRLITEIEKSPIKKVLFVSSTSVYKNENKILVESDTEGSASPLLAIENLFRNNRQFKTTIVRFGGLIGYSRHPGRFFKKGRPLQNPDSTVNLIHRDDCINIISQIVEQGIWGELFNGCADSHPTKREFYSQAARDLDVAAPEFDESGPNSFKIISNQKLKQILNYQFLFPDLMEITFIDNG